MEFSDVETIKKDTSDEYCPGKLRRDFEKFVEASFFNMGLLYSLRKDGVNIISEDRVGNDSMSLYQCKKTEDVYGITWYSSRDCSTNECEFVINVLEIGRENPSGFRERIENVLSDLEKKAVEKSEERV